MKLVKLVREKFIDRQGGFGLNEILGIAAALIIAAFIIIPEMKDFAEKLMTGLESWWNNTISKSIFPTSK
ncbi:MAG TPA: hypothetical protein PK767_02075 [Clostridiales bacterium]|nr:hypothetical protein [Clostridiales bacterium]HPP35014.1 hypothetical protein [Clostridiales bacterium]